MNFVIRTELSLPVCPGNELNVGDPAMNHVRLSTRQNDALAYADIRGPFFDELKHLEARLQELSFAG